MKHQFEQRPLNTFSITISCIANAPGSLAISDENGFVGAEVVQAGQLLTRLRIPKGAFGGSQSDLYLASQDPVILNFRVIRTRDKSRVTSCSGQVWSDENQISQFDIEPTDEWYATAFPNPEDQTAIYENSLKIFP